MKINYIGKICSLLLIILWVYWMISDNANFERRLYQINYSLDNGDIGDLGEQDEAVLNEVIPWLMSASGNNDIQWILNGPVDPTRLNIYTTSTGVEHITHTTAGNAVYDAEIDAIFLHEDLINGIHSVEAAPGENISIIWSDRHLYLSFVFLHELGHRVLHRKSGKLFDDKIVLIDPAAQKREIEADQFAFVSLSAAYQNDLRSDSSTVWQFGDEAFAYLTSGKIELERKHEVILGFDISSFVENWLRDQIENGTFSPYHFDAAHPNFGHRLKSMARTIDASLYSEKALETIYRAKDILTRIDAIAENLVGQVEFPFVVKGLSISRGMLWGISKDGNWATANINEIGEQNPNVYTKIRAFVDESIPNVPLISDAAVLGVVGNEDGPWVVIDSHWNVYLRREEEWDIVGLNAPEKPEISLVYRSVWDHGVGSKRKALVISSDGDPIFGETGVHLIGSDGSIVEKKTKRIAEEIGPKLDFNSELFFAFGSVNEEHICLAVFDRSELMLPRLRGVVALDHNLNVSRIYEFPKEAIFSEVSEATVLCPGDTDNLVVIGRHFETVGYQVWDVRFKDGAFKGLDHRADILHLGERFSGRHYEQPSSSFFSAEIYQPENTLHVSLWHDGYFIVDSVGEVGILFHPSDGAMVKSGSMVAIHPGQWGRNTYVLSVDKMVRQEDGASR